MNKKKFVLKQRFVDFSRALVTSLSGGNSCIVCSNVAGVVPVCSECKKFYFHVGQILDCCCKFCGKALISENNVCMECRENVLLKHCDGVFPIFSYRLWNTNALCRWKLEGERAFSSFFSELMNLRIKQVFAEFGQMTVVPVPPRPGKLRSNGWDQIEDLAAFLECFYGFEVMRIMERKSSVEQKSLGRLGRMESIGKNYAVIQECSKLPEKVCLIDDVLTTGSTLESCALKLKEAGVEKVYAVTLFSVDR